MEAHSYNPRKWCSHCRKDNHNDSECWSTRVVSVTQFGRGPLTSTLDPVPGVLPFLTMPEEPPGFQDINPIFMCRDREHGFPSHLHVPSGKKYVHYCPTCRFKSVAFGVVVS